MVIDNSFNNSLLLCWIDRINITCTMQLRLTPIVSFVSVKNFIDIHNLIAAFVLIQSFIIPFNLRVFGMESAVTHFCNRVILLAPVAPN